ncbi:MAG: hypothetical protein ACYCOR_00370 [Acidobacteriaceae bacterium]
MTSFRFASIVLGIALLTSSPVGIQGQAQRSPSTADARRPAHRPEGFFDYAKGKVNPTNKDYGTEAQEMRDGFVSHSIDDVYFWSNAFTLTLLIGVTTFLFLHLRAADKREVICAALIAQLWNGRVSDKMEIERRTEQYNSLVESHNVDVERALMSQSPSPTIENQVTSKLQRTVEELTEKPAAEIGPDRNTPHSVTSVPISGKPSGTNPAGLEQHSLLLQRRIEAMKNTEENLKERLNRTTLLLEQERSRNRTLKGA